MPLRERAGRVIAAMNVSGHASRTSKTQLIKHFLPRLQAAAAAIDASLGLR